MLELNKIYQGNCLEVLKTFPDKSIDCCVTSPPYWGLRNYGVEGQLGLEPKMQDFINNLVDIFNEVKRVLKDTGTCFVNLGDTYNGNKTGNTNGTHGGTVVNKGNIITSDFNRKASENIKEKSLCLVPERFAIEMVSRGWILRNQIIWHKPNQMPQSATDRFTVDFEKIFFFVKKQKYFFEQQLEKSLWAEFDKRSQIKGGKLSNGKTASNKYATNKVAYTEGGMRNVRTTWSINTEPNYESHFATYPQRLVERMIKAGCPENGVVIDPFSGSGTTGLYARKSYRNFIGIELNPDYIKIAEKRLQNQLGMFA